MPNKRTIDLLTESYKDQMTARRKYEFKDANGVVKANLYFKPLTRDDRVRAQAAANTDDALTISTYLLCKNAEKEDGSPAFSPADAPNLQRELPENVLNEIELFLATELGKTLQELRSLITEEELIFWAAYYEVKNEREKREINRQRANRR